MALLVLQVEESGVLVLANFCQDWIQDLSLATAAGTPLQNDWSEIP